MAGCQSKLLKNDCYKVETWNHKMAAKHGNYSSGPQIPLRLSVTLKHEKADKCGENVQLQQL